MQKQSVSDLNRRPADVIKALDQGTEVIITKRNLPIAVLLGWHAFQEKYATDQSSKTQVNTKEEENVS